ncbi:unnamed protein product [Brassica oleracea]|uniref:(rape) hypothetical protein n=1 Tax=Brassica napus TaxID=3708 RepID=A0A816II18_BRANA|nr:unnamed protein product [Brassica napus]
MPKEDATTTANPETHTVRKRRDPTTTLPLNGVQDATLRTLGTNPTLTGRLIKLSMTVRKGLGLLLTPKRQYLTTVHPWNQENLLRLAYQKLQLLMQRKKGSDASKAKSGHRRTHDSNQGCTFNTSGTSRHKPVHF